MAKFTSRTPATPAAKPAAKIPAPIKTEVRNSPIPKVASAAPGAAAVRQITHEQIAQRAYFIWKNKGGSEMENWIQAERELRAGK